MATLKEADFFYGAILSHCFHVGIRPMLIERGKDRQLYNCITDGGDFVIFAKYRSAPGTNSDKGYQSWHFTFSKNDLEELLDYTNKPFDFSMALVCGHSPLRKSEIVFLHKDEVILLLESHKESVTVSRKSGEKKFRIPVNGGREEGLQISSNRTH